VHPLKTGKICKLYMLSPCSADSLAVRIAQSIMLLATQASPSCKFGNRALMMHLLTHQQFVTRTNMRK